MTKFNSQAPIIQPLDMQYFNGLPVQYHQNF